MDDLILPKGRYPESFMFISLLEVSGIGGHWGFLTGDMEDMVISVIVNDVFLP